MSLLTRRQLGGTACFAGLASYATGLPAAETNSSKGKRVDARSLRITDIEAHEIVPPYQDFNATALARYQGEGLQSRTVFVVNTDAGLTGLGEATGKSWPKREALTKYIGTSPFDWINDTDNLPINGALYDLMGQALGLPIWKLLGPKVRSWIPVAAWTVSQPPDAMAEEVRQAARRGFHWLKYHVDELQNAIDQTAAMQKVAPKGFKLHYDFNADSNVEAVYPVLRELESFPVAGRIEDPIDPKDPDGWRVLRQKCKLTIIGHHAPVEFMIDHLYDGYMAGHAAIGHATKVAALAEVTKTPMMLQQIGGTINLALLAHEAAAFKMAILDHVNLCHLWKDDVTVEAMPVVAGSVAVPRGPGLGVTLNREKLEQYKKAKVHPRGRYLVRVRYTGGPTNYFRHDPDAGTPSILRSLVSSNVPGYVPGYGNPLLTDFWEDDGSPEYQRIWKEAEKGPVTAVNSR